MVALDVALLYMDVWVILVINVSSGSYNIVYLDVV